MRCGHCDGIAARGVALSHRDSTRILEEAGLLCAVGRSLARLSGVLAWPIAKVIRATSLPERIKLALLWRREFRKVRDELGCYSRHELMADLRLIRSEIPAIAAEAADERVAAFRQHGAWWS